MSRGPRESDRECDLCRVRLRWRRPTSALLSLLLIGLVFWQFLGACQFARYFAGVDVSAAVVGLCLVLVGELVLFAAVGGSELLLHPWEICPRCRRFRLPDERYRRLLRHERVFRRLSWYLLVPAAFLLALWIFRGPDAQLALPLVFGGLVAQGLAALRPRSRRIEQGGVRIAEESESARR